MVTNKAILGFFVVLIIVIVAIVLVRRNPNFMARFRSGSTPTIGKTLTPTKPPTKNTNITGTVAGTDMTSGITSGVTLCTNELKSRCNAQESPVCGTERVVVSGAESTRSLTFKSACTYCSLYGSDDVLDLGDEKYYPLGYTAGACAAATK